jgi:hypothetical protein
MKKRVIWFSIAAIVIIIAILIFVGKVQSNKEETPSPILTGIIVQEAAVQTPEITPTLTGEVSMSFAKQPTALAWNYTDNGTMLRAWAEKNKVKIAIPAGAKNASITIVLAKAAKYEKLPGNVQFSVDGKTLTNGRLDLAKSVDWMLNGPIYTYALDAMFTQDKPKWVDLSVAIWKELWVKAWIWESKNQIESITINYSL